MFVSNAKAVCFECKGCAAPLLEKLEVVSVRYCPFMSLVILPAVRLQASAATNSPSTMSVEGKHGYSDVRSIAIDSQCKV